MKKNVSAQAILFVLFFLCLISCTRKLNKKDVIADNILLERGNHTPFTGKIIEDLHPSYYSNTYKDGYPNGEFIETNAGSVISKGYYTNDEFNCNGVKFLRNRKYSYILMNDYDFENDSFEYNYLIVECYLGDTNVLNSLYSEMGNNSKAWDVIGNEIYECTKTKKYKLLTLLFQDMVVDPNKSFSVYFKINKGVVTLDTCNYPVYHIKEFDVR